MFDEYEQSEKSRSRFQKRSVALAFGAVVSGVLFILSIPTIIFVFFGMGVGGFFYHKAHTLVSPDGRHVVNVYRRASFPVFGIIDFPADVSVRFGNADGGVLQDVEFEIHEYPELTEPQAFWEGDRVYITHIESHREVELSFSIPVIR